MIQFAKTRMIVLCLISMWLALPGCKTQMIQPADQNVLNKAAMEATAILQQAQATALVLQAQAQATEMMAGTSIRGQVSGSEPTMAVSISTPARDTPSDNPTPEPPQDPISVQEVQILGVSFAAEGGFIMVRYLAPPEEAEKWWQGSVVVTDEANGNVYNEIPVMPKIGPIIGRPKRIGQIGYVMLINTTPQLEPGALVTVQLGKFTFEHVPVKQ
jgi:hypothetical protein